MRNLGREQVAPPGVEAVVAYVASVAFFALASVAINTVDRNAAAFVLAALCIAAILAIGHFCGVAFAVPLSLAGLIAFDWFYVPPTHAAEFPDAANSAQLALFLLIAVLIGQIASRARRRASGSEQAWSTLDEEHAALRRVATLVARGVAPSDVFAAVAEEIGRVLGVEYATIDRYEPDGTATVVASWGRRGRAWPVNSNWTLDGDSTTGRVFRTRRPARIDDYEQASGEIADGARDLHIRSTVGAPIMVEDELWGAAFAVSVGPDPLAAETEARMANFTELVATAIANAQARTELARLAEEQAALRRVATLVAQGVPPEELIDAVAEEIGRVMRLDLTSIVRYGGDGTATIVAMWGGPLRMSSVVQLEDDSITSRIARTRLAVRIDDYEEISGEVAESVRLHEVSSGVGAPIIVDDRLWGAATALSTQPSALPADTEDRIAKFTDLIAIAISNAESRAELTASRRRVVAAADETRRQLERDLHDGVQQRLVSLALELRNVEDGAPEKLASIRPDLTRIGQGLTGVLDDLREISRGIHPAILSNGGLEPALRALARRSAVPVELEARIESRLPERVEVAAYYVASEALANVAKHAQASAVEMHVERRNGFLHLSISDDGVGGADPGRGSGLIGLTDRVAAVGGSISVRSPAGEGTSLDVELPMGGD